MYGILGLPKPGPGVRATRDVAGITGGEVVLFLSQGELAGLQAFV